VGQYYQAQETGAQEFEIGSLGAATARLELGERIACQPTRGGGGGRGGGWICRFGEEIGSEGGG